jgi:hypothetical protein
MELRKLPDYEELREGLESEEQKAAYDDQLKHLVNDPCFRNLRMKIISKLGISFCEYTRRRVMGLDPDTGGILEEEATEDLGPINNRQAVRTRVEGVIREMEKTVYSKRSPGASKRSASKMVLAGLKMLDDMDASAKATDAFAEKIGSMGADELQSFLENVGGYLTGSTKKSPLSAVAALGNRPVAGGTDRTLGDAADDTGV